MTVEWEYPEPREGFMGHWDRFISPGATRSENVIMLIIAAIGGMAVLLYQYIANIGWDFLQLVIIAIIAFDIIGGAIANNTAVTKR